MLLRIASYNVNLSVSIPLRFHAARSRACRLADALYASTPYYQLDVICLQELVVFRDTVLSSFVHHPFHTKNVHASLLGNNIKLVASGLAIVSKYPILEQRHRIFSGQGYHAEQLMAKAVLYARVAVPSGVGGGDSFKVVHVLTTHTQAWSNAIAQQTRLSQARQIKVFIDSLHIPVSEPLVLSGDFNIDMYENHSLWSEFCHTMNMVSVLPPYPLFSFDPSSNMTVGSDDPNEYTLRASKSGCYDTLVRDGVCACCPRQLLDGTVYSRHHLAPTQTPTVSVIKVKSRLPFKAHINSSQTWYTRDVSDHYCVLTEFMFPSHSTCYSQSELTDLVRRRETLGIGTSHDATHFDVRCAVWFALFSTFFFALLTK